MEEDKGTRSTPKLAVARWQLRCKVVAACCGCGRARGGGQGWPPPLAAVSDTNSVNCSPLVSLRTDLLNMHLYAILNWVFCLIHTHLGMHSFQTKVLRFLISCQYRGVEAAFGLMARRDKSNRERLCVCLVSS